MTPSDPTITVSNLTKRFGQFTAVDNISFSVGKGEIFGFLGANGAGKTTAIRMLCGLSRPTSGSGTVAGYDIVAQLEEVKRHIGYMSQHFSLYSDLTVMQNINLFSTIYGMTRSQIAESSERIFQRLGMTEMLNRRVATLPVGWKQRLAFATSTIHNPAVLFLDEPTGGVDPTTRRQFWELIYQAASDGMTIFVTTHYLDEAEYCNRISIMVDGCIRALDTPANLKAIYHAADIDEVFRKVALTATRSE